MSSTARLAACAEISLLSASKCAEGLSSIPNIMTQRSDYSVLPILRTVLTDEKYAEGVRRFSLKLMDIVESGGSPSGNLFDDLNNAFASTGLNSNDSTEFTWNVIAVLSSQGPDLAMTLNLITRYAREDYKSDPRGNSTIKLALQMIACSLPALNFRTARSGHLYSMPSNIRGTCNDGKPYHFWMSAFLAYRLAKELKDGKAAAAAAYTAAKGYQMLSTAGTRRPDRVFSQSSFDAFSNVIRMDLAAAALGAQFGAESALGMTHSTQNLDERIQSLLRAAGPSPLLSETDAKSMIANDLPKTYFYWQQMFSPNKAFEFK